MTNWELKDRTYKLKESSPLTYKIRRTGMLWFDEDKKYWIPELWVKKLGE